METDFTPTEISPLHFARNVLVKGLLFFLLANLVFGWLHPLPWLGHLSAYNRLIPGRLRLPYGDDPSRAYNLSLFQLDAMFASHVIAAGPKPTGEYRVVLIGDSSTWGFLLKPEQTLSGALNRAGYRLSDGRQVRAYNLGYPVMSITKDVLLLKRAMEYQPDLIVWPLTLESLPYDKQLFPPLLQHNAASVRQLISTYHLNLDPHDPQLITPTYWQQTIWGDRRTLADMLRLQLYGVLWAATGIDQDIPETYTPRAEDLSAEVTFHNLQPPHLAQNDLALDVLQAGLDLAGNTPVLLINEPVFISHEQNSDIRYNFYYPRWAYDDYRQIMAETSHTQGWNYLDMWQAVDNREFTNSAVHLTPKGEEQFARQVGEAILSLAQTTQTDIILK